MELTKVEKAIIEAYRNGAKLEVNYYRFDNEELDEAIDRIKPFGKITSISDFTNPPHPFVLVRSEEHANLEINALLNVSRK